MKQFVFLLLVAGMLAGCASSEEDTPDTTEPETPVVMPRDIPEVSGEDTVKMLKTFAEGHPVRKGNSADHVASRDWIADQFASFNLTVWRQEFTNGIDQENICGIKWGHDRGNWTMVGGHYDTTTTGSSHDDQSQGIYDDGSGTIMTVKLAEAFSQVETNYTIAFCAFDGEERGLQGSRAVFTGLAVDRDTVWNETFYNFVGMIDLDMIGLNWPAIDAPIYFDQNDADLKAYMMSRVTEIGMPEDKIEYTGITLGQSDYAHWYNNGVPTGFFISNFEKWQVPGGNQPVIGGVVIPQGAYPFWHVADTWETMLLMAGSEQGLYDGFQTALDLAAGGIHYFAQLPVDS